MIVMAARGQFRTADSTWARSASSGFSTRTRATSWSSGSSNTSGASATHNAFASQRFASTTTFHTMLASQALRSVADDPLGLQRGVLVLADAEFVDEDVV